jgi:hypothetical protein
MDKYVEIQKIFSDFYFKKILPYIKSKDFKYNNFSLLVVINYSLLLVGAVSLLLLAFNNDVWPYFVPHFVYVIVMVTGVLSPLAIVMVVIRLIGEILETMSATRDIDRKLKRKFFPELFKQLEFMRWIDAEPWAIDDENKYANDVISTLEKHKLMDIQTFLFELDDVFEGKFSNINFSIFEICNKYNIFQMVYTVIVFYIILPVILLAPFLKIFLCIKDINLTICYVVLCTWIVLFDLYAVFIVKDKNMRLNFWDNKFRGVVAIFDLEKLIKGQVLIFENHYDNKLVKGILAKGYKKVCFEDEEFNKRYSVYATDQVEARYALTTAMMERLKNLSHYFKSKYIRASFMFKKFVIAVQSDKDLFRLASAWKETEPKDYQTMFLELISILKITDTLNLQNKTGL